MNTEPHAASTAIARRAHKHDLTAGLREIGGVRGVPHADRTAVADHEASAIGIARTRKVWSGTMIACPAIARTPAQRRDDDGDHEQQHEQRDAHGHGDELRVLLT